MGSWRNSSSGKILWLIIMPLVLIFGFMALKKSNWDIRFVNFYSGVSSVTEDDSAEPGPVSSENLGGLDWRWTADGGGGQMAEAPSPSSSSSSPTITLEEDMDMQQPVCTFSHLFYLIILVLGMIDFTFSLHAVNLFLILFSIFI